VNSTCPWFAGRPHILLYCCHPWNAENASLNRALRNGGKRTPYPQELAHVEACRRLRPPEPICASAEINSSAEKHRRPQRLESRASGASAKPLGQAGKPPSSSPSVPCCHQPDSCPIPHAVEIIVRGRAHSIFAPETSTTSFHLASSDR
jgi:hypothetical protein